ncbi:hypothetical protein RKD49_003913 [Streptomyces glaucescens]
MRLGTNLGSCGGDGVGGGAIVTVAFGTHIIGAPGIDWGTAESTEELPVPVEAGTRDVSVQGE